MIECTDDTHIMNTLTLYNLELNETDKNNSTTIIRICNSYLDDRLLTDDSIICLCCCGSICSTICIDLTWNHDTILSCSWVSELALVSISVGNTAFTVVPVNEFIVPNQAISTNLIISPLSVLVSVSLNL